MGGSGCIAKSLNLTVASGAFHDTVCNLRIINAAPRSRIMLREQVQTEQEATLDVSGLSAAFMLGSRQTSSDGTASTVLNGKINTGSGTFR